MTEINEGFVAPGFRGVKTRFMGNVSPKHVVFEVPQVNTTEIVDNLDFVGKTSPIGLGRSGMAGIVNVIVKGDRL